MPGFFGRAQRVRERTGAGDREPAVREGREGRHAEIRTILKKALLKMEQNLQSFSKR